MTKKNLHLNLAMKSKVITNPEMKFGWVGGQETFTMSFFFGDENHGHAIHAIISIGRTTSAALN